jgi:hypothetical protein
VIRQTRGIGVPLTRQLQVEFVVGGRGLTELPQLICEPGYSMFGMSAATGGAGFTPQVTLDPHALNTIRQSLPGNLQPAAGGRTAVLDTGIDPAQVPGCAATMIDFSKHALSGLKRVPAADANGHGTAMAQIIRAVNTRAAITPIKVLSDLGGAHSYEVLSGLSYALHSGQFDCVVTCLGAPASGNCGTSFGITFEWMLGYCTSRLGGSTPPIIAAVGNNASKNSEYPAKIAGVVVAVATDAQGNDADYNSILPAHAHAVRAYGGTSTTPVGTITGSVSSQAGDLWGSSIAAAAIAGHHLP